MTRTMSDEAYGVGVDVTIGADYVLRLPYGENGATFWCIRPSSAGLSVRLPVGPFCRKGEKIVIANHGAHSLSVRDVFTTLIATVAAGTKTSFWLIDAVPLQGTWVTRNVSSSIGATLVHDRDELFVRLGTWAGTGFNLRDYCNTALGYAGLKPASIYCQLANSIVIGSETTAEPSFDTGTWPAGSTLLLELGAGTQIVGRGGSGGKGGDVPPGVLSQPGSAGGDALVVRLDTGLVNYGIISGGGGGGGGGGAVIGQGGGGGGGGGAGYQPSLGGAAGAGGLTSPAGHQGAAGAIGVGGNGGLGGSGTAGAGGNGGGPGANGSSGTIGAAGGATGNATKRLTSVALNLIVAGTINGPQVTF